MDSVKKDNSRFKVYVVGGNRQVVGMWRQEGYTIVSSVDRADIVQFTGGADVDPALYGEAEHTQTHTYTTRDREEEGVFNECVARNIPMTGICRGGQFLHVMNSGKMWQHVNKHSGNGRHPLYDVQDPKREISATSTHHQMMRKPDDDVDYVLVATAGSLSTYKQSMLSKKTTYHHVPSEEDIEVLFYPLTRSFCFQPHPEYVSDGDPLRQYYFEQIDKHLCWKEDSQEELELEGNEEGC